MPLNVWMKTPSKVRIFVENGEIFDTPRRSIQKHATSVE